jgi:cyclopropane fatty-acyl-phospholipid synthase-like methyltransferase
MSTVDNKERDKDESWNRVEVSTPETTRQEQITKVLSILKGLHATYLIEVGTTLGLFEALVKAPQGTRPSALASSLGLNEKYVRSWCETACALELLDYDPYSGYHLAPYMDEILGRPESTYYMGLFPLTHILLSRDYASYPNLFRTGGSHPFQEHDTLFFETIAKTLQVLPRIFIDQILPKMPGLQSRFEEGISILDFGCGGGYAVVEFARRYPNVSCMGTDIEPNSIRMAEALTRSAGLQDRAQVRLVDSGPLPEDMVGKFDLVTMFLVLHEIRPDLKSAAIEQCARALRPGGQLVIFDERYPSTPAELRDRLLIYAVMAQWYELTWGNSINTREEILSLLKENHLRVVDETSFSRFYIVSAAIDNR